MTVRVSALTDADGAEYDAFHASIPSAQLFTSGRYRRFLRGVLSGARECYLVARRDGEIAGALPLFECVAEGIGRVVNSLPFFGSNGGLVLAPGAAADDRVARALLDAFADFSRTASAATLISNPLAGLDSLYARALPVRFRTGRIGLFTDLPPDGPDLDDRLMSCFEPVRRRAVRKGLKSGCTFEHTDDVGALDALARIHRENMEAIGVVHKPPAVFDAIRAVFPYDADHRVYVARHDGRIVAGLLVVYCNGTAEYFTPATEEAFRSHQPMSALVFHAMRDAVRSGHGRWNWGGTQQSQTGVYDFKKRWGTHDLPYYYYTTVSDDALLSRTQRELVAGFPGFFVVPFSELRP